MNTQPNEVAQTMNEVRPLYWSIRRELWENRSIYIAPLVVAGLVLFGFLVSMLRLAHKLRTTPGFNPSGESIVGPYVMAATMILFTGVVVGIFYCLDALSGERRDRSILFWKSLPVSDFTTVLSKACIPLAVLPLLTFSLALITQCVMLMMNTTFLLGSGNGIVTLWTRLPLIQMTMVMLYGITVHALWFAPIYSWLLLVSAWARRAVILWALLPFVAALIFEKVAIGTTFFISLIKYRLAGAMTEAFTARAPHSPITTVTQLDPLRFFSSSGLWLGLIFAAICLAIAIRLRHDREPV
jgi:ABC-2 type transport system permease protein